MEDNNNNVSQETLPVEQSKETDYKQLYEQAQQEKREMAAERSSLKEKNKELLQYKETSIQQQQEQENKLIAEQYGKDNIEKVLDYKSKGLKQEEINKLIIDDNTVINPMQTQQVESTPKQFAWVADPNTGKVEYKEIK